MLPCLSDMEELLITVRRATIAVATRGPLPATAAAAAAPPLPPHAAAVAAGGDEEEVTFIFECNEWEPIVAAINQRGRLHGAGPRGRAGRAGRIGGADKRGGTSRAVARPPSVKDVSQFAWGAPGLGALGHQESMMDMDMETMMAIQASMEAS
jgi:hypothetical protein